jgi:hypothetical protein
MSTVDRRTWSLPLRGLSEMIGDLQQSGILSSDVHTLARSFREANVYPARDFESRCTPRPPDIFVTYDWRYNFIDLQEAAWNGLLYIGDELSRRYPLIDPSNFEVMLFDDPTLWIDFVFIDQSARDIRTELAIMPDLIDSSKLHFALSHTALTRSWCCYELALYNKRFLEPEPEEGPPPVPLLGSLLAPMPLGYRGWADTQTSVAEDKIFLEEQLNDLYPHGTLGVDALMIQASLVGEHIYQLASPVQTGLAVEEAISVADGWLRRRGWIPET